MKVTCWLGFPEDLKMFHIRSWWWRVIRIVGPRGGFVWNRSCSFGERSNWDVAWQWLCELHWEEFLFEMKCSLIYILKSSSVFSLGHCCSFFWHHRHRHHRHPHLHLRLSNMSNQYCYVPAPGNILGEFGQVSEEKLHYEKSTSCLCFSISIFSLAWNIPTLSTRNQTN